MNLYEAFDCQVQAAPDHPAVLEMDSTYTFAQLADMAGAAASLLPKNCKFVGIVLDHSVWMIASMLGVLKNEAAYVPAEADFPIGRTRFMMKESHVSVIVTQEKYAERFEGFPLIFVEDVIEHWKSLQKGKTIQEAEQKAVEGLDLDIVRSNPAFWMKDHSNWSQKPAYVLYTSGSTGVPKGVVITNANVLHYVEAFDQEFHPGYGDIMLQYSVCSFDIFTEEVFTTLLNGAALFIPDQKTHDDLPSLLEACDKYNVTEISGFPYLLKEMDAYPLPKSIRLLISGGDVLRGSYVENLMNKTKVYNTYGPSETTVCVTYFDCRPDTVLEDGTFPIGHPVAGTTIEILDENLEPVAPGETGEICIYGEGVCSGYLDASKNAMFTEHNGQKMYRSGDLGCILPDGNIAFFGRLDDQIMVWGKRVEPKEVESVLCKCDGVQNAVVTTTEDEAHMHHIKAYVQPEDGLDIEELRKEMKESLTSFMIPETFVLVDNIPLSERGKPDLKQLAAMEIASD